MGKSDTRVLCIYVNIELSILNRQCGMNQSCFKMCVAFWVKWNEIELISNGNQSKCNEIFCIHTKPKNQELHFGDIESKAVSVEVMSDTEFRLQFAQNIMLANCLDICICVLFVYGTVYGICVFNTTFREQAEKLFTILSHITKLKSQFCFNVFFCFHWNESNHAVFNDGHCFVVQCSLRQHICYLVSFRYMNILG